MKDDDDEASSCNCVDEQLFCCVIVDFCRPISDSCDVDDGCVIAVAATDESSVDCDKDWDDDKDAVVIAVAPAVAVAADERTNFLVFGLVALYCCCWTNGAASLLFYFRW